MSPFPIHPPLTSDQVSKKSLERLPGKTAYGQTDGRTTFPDSSSTKVENCSGHRARVSTLVVAVGVAVAVNAAASAVPAAAAAVIAVAVAVAGCCCCCCYC